MSICWLFFYFHFNDPQMMLNKGLRLVKMVTSNFPLYAVNFLLGKVEKKGDQR